jgi:hypothetical protein
LHETSNFQEINSWPAYCSFPEDFLVKHGAFSSFSGCCVKLEEIRSYPILWLPIPERLCGSMCPFFLALWGGPRVHLKGPVNLKSIEAERRKDPNQLG